MAAGLANLDTEFLNADGCCVATRATISTEQAVNWQICNHLRRLSDCCASLLENIFASDRIALLCLCSQRDIIGKIPKPETSRTNDEVALGLCKAESADIGANHNRANSKHMTGRIMSRSVPFWEICTKQPWHKKLPFSLLSSSLLYIKDLSFHLRPACCYSSCG